MRALTVAQVRREIELMEFGSRRFYQVAADHTTDAGLRQLLGDLASAEQEHTDLAERMDLWEQTASGIRAEEEATQRRMFVLQIVQPGLAGLMDGSVSTWPAVRGGLRHAQQPRRLPGRPRTSVGAGISMGFAEALSDDGEISGRGHPLLRGAVCGLMTSLGGLGTRFPYLIGDFRLATGVAATRGRRGAHVISWIRHHYMDTPFLSAAFQVILGGVLVFIAGILIGSS